MMDTAQDMMMQSKILRKEDDYMWKFRRIGDYYELLDGTETLYLCKRLDSIMVDTLEDLCNRHNAEITEITNKLSKLNDYIDDYDAIYDTGYSDGYRRGLADTIACEDKLT